MEWEHKLLRVCLETLDDNGTLIRQEIIVRFQDIRDIFTGADSFNSYILFKLYCAPSFEEVPVYRTMNGDKHDNRNFKHRVSHLDDAHRVIAAYNPHLCVILHDSFDLTGFNQACAKAKIYKPRAVQFYLEKRNFFSPQRVQAIGAWYRRLNCWPVAFQIEALLRNGLMNTEELKTILGPTEAYYGRHGAEATVALLRAFNERIQRFTPNQKPVDILTKLSQDSRRRLLHADNQGTHMCYHVTVTPTRIFLEGPYPDVSNSIVSKYDPEYFLRVSFKDEDEHQYRWDRAVDGEEFLLHKVGGCLLKGISIAGRHFNFLAYSSSALKGHSVWFMATFEAPDGGYLTADEIRASIGDFSKTTNGRPSITARSPARYAARMAQRFTATQRSVWINKDQWSFIDDISPTTNYRKKNFKAPKSQPFTDGVGTISPDLADRIYESLSANGIQTNRDAVRSTAFQIRFLGFKGMVSVDASLSGIQMRLRPSMDKFAAFEEEGYLEIAGRFSKPGYMHLNQPYIVILEDLGVPLEAFMELQRRAVADVYTVKSDMRKFSEFLRKHHLGNIFQLDMLAKQLSEHGLEFGHDDPQRRIAFPFFTRLVAYSTTHVLRELKFKARIPVPQSYQLVGVADEGMAWVKRGMKNVKLLEEGEIFACIHENGKEPFWLEGPCIISRSPTVHPGDVQRAIAVGKPPEDRLCAFANLKNCVVFNTRGERSLPSMLGGGDLDGDLYDICMYSPLHPAFTVKAAEYPSTQPKTIADNRDKCDIRDVIEFIPEYIHNDVVGVLSVNLIVTADQSKYGVFDKRCNKLAELCSQAVDYPKSGWAVPMETTPRRLIPYNPDWREGEVATPYKTYYRSERALGHLYRAITLEDPSQEGLAPQPGPPVLSNLVKKLVQPYIATAIDQNKFSEEIKNTFKYYQEEMLIISVTHALKKDPRARLSEEEIVVGTILGSVSNQRMRQERIQRFKVHVEVLVKDVKRE
ncbi:hypothetical protein M422DRAFT_785200, partial [Sphaerobolus stellatus SS14]